MLARDRTRGGLDRLRLADDGTDERSLLGQDLRDVNLVLHEE